MDPQEIEEISREAAQIVANEDTSSNDNEPIEPSTAPPNPRLIDYVQAEFRDMILLSMKYQEAIKNAKTQYKKEYYKKKLAKNNKRILQLLMVHKKLETRNSANTPRTPIHQKAIPSQD